MSGDGDTTQAATVRTLRSAIAWVSGAYLATAGLGTWLALRDGLVGRPFGWKVDMTPLFGFVIGLGTALSAPLVLLLALVAANLLMRQGERAEHRAAGLIALLGAGFFAGMLAEPISWEVFEGTNVGPLIAAIVMANVWLPLLMVVLALRVRGFTRLTTTRVGGLPG